MIMVVEIKKEHKKLFELISIVSQPKRIANSPNRVFTVLIISEEIANNNFFENSITSLRCLRVDFAVFRYSEPTNFFVFHE